MEHKIVWSKDAGDELYEIISYIKNNTGNITAGQIDGRRNLEEILYKKVMEGKIR